jgi:protein-S-isoprenylcysteine O-methyltransferase Ste14
MNIPALISGSIAIIVFSWFYSIKRKRYHGIPRFFAFESIYILILLNLSLWFSDPFSWNQLISWILLILSAIFGLAGYFTLKNRGKATGDFENTTVLVKSGVYGLIRHPLYFSLLLLGTGVMMKNLTPATVAAGVANLVALGFTAATEEREMMIKFGKQYHDYMKETKMFIPFML